MRSNESIIRVMARRRILHKASTGMSDLALSREDSPLSLPMEMFTPAMW